MRQERISRLITQICDHREADPDCEGGQSCPGPHVLGLLRSLDPEQMTDLALAALIAAADRSTGIAALGNKISDMSDTIEGLIESVVTQSGPDMISKLEHKLAETDHDQR